MYVIDTCGYSLSEAYTFPYSHYDLSDYRNFSQRSSRWQRSVETLLHFLLLRIHLPNSYFTGSPLLKNTDISSSNKQKNVGS